MPPNIGLFEKLSLGLGGNVPFIVFDDADIEMTVKVRSPRNTVMPGRPMFAPTVSWCRTASTTEAAGAMKVPDGLEPLCGVAN
jgi:hypothetical protein